MRLFGRPLELLILDVDGVILQVESFVAQNMKAVARKLGLPLDRIDEHFLNIKFGREPAQGSLRAGIKYLWPFLSEEDINKFFFLSREERWGNPWPAIPGSIETINWFRRQNVTLAICTANDRLTLDNQFLAAGVDLAWFAAFSVLESEYRKPHPRALDGIFELTGFSRNHAIYVGDWQADIDVARGAGVRFFGTLSGGMPREFFARQGVPEDHIIDRLSDLMLLVLNHNWLF
ncbi:MAG: phosphoglycolate phosphatase [Parcubacteria group bacterium Gr01-1014_44]|nr:MAG: phosphoglycolate phosphatase [Parcubacteria group bacterium Gr01-1014_44]